MARSVKTKTSKASNLRIISGMWRGKKLPVIHSPGLRPTGNRIRETLFNWLFDQVAGCHCLDLFAGTGALSFEALSRGAREAHMVEIETRVAQQLQSNLEKLQCTSAKVHRADSIAWLKSATKYQHYFDLVFLDPPFSNNLWGQSLSIIKSSGILKQGALIYIEHPKGAPLVYPGLTTLKEKTGGEVRYGLYQLVE